MVMVVAAAVLFFDPFQCAEDLSIRVYLRQICEFTGSQEKN